MRNSQATSNDTILAAANARRTELTAELGRIDAVIAAFDASSSVSSTASGKGRRGRPKGSKNRAKARNVAKTTRVAKAKRSRSSKPRVARGETVAHAGNKARAPRASRAPRVKGMSLIRAVAQVLAESEEPLSVSQIAEGVTKLGMNTKASSFKTMVSQSLGKLSELKVASSKERGVWQSSNGISKYLEQGDTKTETAVVADEIPI